jgi:hypothetical protein
MIDLYSHIPMPQHDLNSICDKMTNNFDMTHEPDTNSIKN